MRLDIRALLWRDAVRMELVFYYSVLSLFKDMGSVTLDWAVWVTIDSQYLQEQTFSFLENTFCLLALVVMLSNCRVK